MDLTDECNRGTVVLRSIRGYEKYMNAHDMYKHAMFRNTKRELVKSAKTRRAGHARNATNMLIK